MHNALFLDEILLVIFGHCYPPKHYSLSGSLADLVALATTCRAFKEPALDVLWTELTDLSSLVRCLPDLCCLKNAGSGDLTYMFKRPLKESERDAVKKYTRRVRSLNVPPDGSSFDAPSLADLLSTSPTDPFFPNIRRLHISIKPQTLALVPHVASPKLRSLNLSFIMTPDFPSLFESFFYSLGSCPNMESVVVVFPPTFSDQFSRIMSQHICCWNYLRTLDWVELDLDIDTLARLSQMPNLSMLSFTLSHMSVDQIMSSNQGIVLSTLKELRMTTTSITTASKLLAHMVLPVIAHLHVFFRATPPRHSVMSFSLALAKICSRLDTLYVVQNPIPSSTNMENVALTLDDVRPFISFNLQQMYIDLDRIIDLSDDSLLEFVSSFNRLSTLCINESLGWRTPGITPTCLAQILHRCPSLRNLSIPIDTRGFRYTIPLQIPTQVTWNARTFFALDMNVVDSVIEAESIPALTAFFADQILTLGKTTALTSWGSSLVVPDAEVYKARWKEVVKLAKQMLLERCHVGSGSV